MSMDLNSVRGRLEAAIIRGLDAGGKVIFDASQDDVPVDKGDLKRSGYRRRRGRKVTIGYRDKVAIIVHENMRARHEHGSAKFLENAMNTKRAAAAEAVADELRKVFR